MNCRFLHFSVIFLILWMTQIFAVGAENKKLPQNLPNSTRKVQLTSGQLEHLRAYAALKKLTQKPGKQPDFYGIFYKHIVENTREILPEHIKQLERLIRNLEKTMENGGNQAKEEKLQNAIESLKKIIAAEKTILQDRSKSQFQKIDTAMTAILEQEKILSAIPLQLKPPRDWLSPQECRRYLPLLRR